MSKPLKFRAWDKQEKRFVPHGSVVRIEVNDPTVWHLHEGGSYHENHSPSCQHLKVSEFSGLKDKNGKEIYEGDVVRVRLPERTSFRMEMYGDSEAYEKTTTQCPAKEVIGVVRLSAASGTRILVKRVKAFEPQHELDDRFDKDLVHPGSYLKIKKTDEVIGNIWESPQLLKGADAA